MKNLVRQVIFPLESITSSMYCEDDIKIGIGDGSWNISSPVASSICAGWDGGNLWVVSWSWDDVAWSSLVDEPVAFCGHVGSVGGRNGPDCGGDGSICSRDGPICGCDKLVCDHDEPFYGCDESFCGCGEVFGRDGSVFDCDESACEGFGVLWRLRGSLMIAL